MARFKVEKIMRGQQTFRPRPLIMRGGVEWNHNIKSPADPDLPNYVEWKEEMMNNTSWKERKVQPMLLKCSKCHRNDLHTLQKPCIFEVDKNHTCKHCAKQSMSKLWKCQCGIPWHTCNTHKWQAHDGPKEVTKEDDNTRPTKVQKVLNAKQQRIEKHKNNNMDISDKRWHA